MLISYLQTLWLTKELRYPAINTLIITLIIITPLCGLLFQCGCDWPWAGLDSKCNFYKAHAEHKCPWCASLFSGLLSTSIAIIAGIWGATRSLRLDANLGVVKISLLRTIFGVLIFLLLAILGASIAAWWQNYPFGMSNDTIGQGIPLN